MLIRRVRHSARYVVDVPTAAVVTVTVRIDPDGSAVVCIEAPRECKITRSEMGPERGARSKMPV